MRIPFLLLDGFVNQALSHVWEHIIIYVVSAILLLIIGFLRHSIMAVINLLFMPIRVQGYWTTELDRGEGYKPHERVKLYQFFNRVWGKTKVNDGTPYRLRGQICGSKLCMVYNYTGKAGFDTGAMLLNIPTKVSPMEGYEVGVDLNEDEVYSFKYRWTKSDEWLF